MPDRTPPRYPDLRVSIRSHNPLALVAAVREELRLARVGRGDIARFTDQALARRDERHVVAVARRWVEVVEAA